MTHRFFTDRRPHTGLTYDAYVEIMAEQAEQAVDGLEKEDIERLGYTKLNLHRSRRIARTYAVSDELGTRLDRIVEPQLWMILTEPWCGDSAQCLPYIATMAERNPAVDLRILLRDDNPDIMDLYLTGGSRSIPRVVAFDADGGELWDWGPRPAGAQAVFDVAKTEGLEKLDILERLHLWYGRNRGEALVREMVGVISGAPDASTSSP